MAKRILTGLRLDKIAAVDRPCQEHATMTIMKRDDAGSPGTTTDERSVSMSDLEKKVGELEGKIAELTKSLETSTSALAVADAMAKMSDKDKAHLEGLKDEEAKKAFLAMTPDARSAVVDKAAEADEVVKIDGRDIRKSLVGADTFAVMKAQADRIAKAEDDIRKERDERIMSDLRKRADDEFGHVPGSTDERADMLKAMAGMTDPVRKSFEAVFKVAEEAHKGAFVERGSRGGNPDLKKSGDAFLAKAAEIAKRDNITSAEALKKARQEDPAGFKAFQEAA